MDTNDTNRHLTNFIIKSADKIKFLVSELKGFWQTKNDIPIRQLCTRFYDSFPNEADFLEIESSLKSEIFAEITQSLLIELRNSGKTVAKFDIRESHYEKDKIHLTDLVEKVLCDIKDGCTIIMSPTAYTLCLSEQLTYKPYRTDSRFIRGPLDPLTAMGTFTSSEYEPSTVYIDEYASDSSPILFLPKNSFIATINSLNSELLTVSDEIVDPATFERFKKFYLNLEFQAIADKCILIDIVSYNIGFI